MRSTDTPPATAAQVGFFSVPEPAQQAIFSYLNLKNPQLKIINGEAIEAEQAEVVAFTTYHLIDAGKDAQPRYFLGFAKRDSEGAVQYAKEVLDKNSTFYRVVTEDPDFRTPFMMKYLELTIKAMDGIVANDLQDLIQVHKTLKALAPSFTAGRKMVIQFGKSDLLQRCLQHVAFGEQAKANSILEVHPEFMLSGNRREVVSCTEKCTVHDVTAFEFALWSGDWHMWKMMWKIVEDMPEAQKEEYRADLLEQLKRFQEGSITSTIDNLSVSGLRVLEVSRHEPTNRQKAAVIKQEAYHLILHRDADENITGCELGFYQKNAGGQYEYVQHELVEGSELRAFLLNPGNKALFQRDADYHHHILHHKNILALAKTEIQALGGETEVCDNKSAQHYIESLQQALQEYKPASSSSDEWIDGWSVKIGRLQRACFSAVNFAEYWMKPGIEWGNLNEAVFQGPRPGAASFYEGRPLLPIPQNFEGLYGWAAAELEGWSAVQAVNYFCQVASENLKTLGTDLHRLSVSRDLAVGCAP